VSFPVELEVLVELPRAGIIKRRSNGSVDFVSPLPAPFNYGSVPGKLAADGDEEDVVVLGPRLAKGTRLRVPVLARVHFIDAGVYDGKWICGDRLQPEQQRQLERFFALYAWCKRWLNRSRGRFGTTEFAGLELAPSDRERDLTGVRPER
jgi:inorganic pyrophosphatase